MSTLQVSFRGRKVDISLVPNTLVKDVKLQVSKVVAESNLFPSDIKLIYKGKIFPDDEIDIYHHLEHDSSKSTRVYKIMAIGLSAAEKKAQKEKHAVGIRNASRIQDDLSCKPENERQMARQNLPKRWAWWFLALIILAGSWKVDRIGIGVIFVLIIGYTVPI